MPTLNELLHAASRTFALGIDLLPEPLRAEIELGYLLLRVSDYLEDNESMGDERKAALLVCWAEVLEGTRSLDDPCPVNVEGAVSTGDLAPTPADTPPGERPATLASVLESASDTTPDAMVAREVRQVHAALLGLRPFARATLVKHVSDSTRGMARWALRGPDFPDEDALDDYMHEVAGRVGWLLTDLFGSEIPEMDRQREDAMSLAREFGLALQTVNVIRGLHSDWKRGWVFVPRTLIREGIEPLQLFTDGVRTEADERRILRALIPKAEQHLKAAGDYISMIPARERGIRLFCLLPYLFAVRTLALSRRNPRVFEQETKMTRPEVKRIVWWTRLLGRSDRWARWYAGRLARSGG